MESHFGTPNVTVLVLVLVNVNVPETIGVFLPVMLATGFASLA